VPGDRDAALEDRVKAVQRKGFLKRHRLEVGILAPASVNDAFYQKLGIGGRLAFNLQDSFALSVRGTYFWALRTSHVREGKQAFSSQLLASDLRGQVMLDGIWYPMFGKSAVLGSKILHFDLYLLAGAGAVWSATSFAPRNEGPHAAVDLGGGLRFYPSDWIALDAGLVGTFYPDQPATTAPSTLQAILAAHVGLTFFFPMSFEYVHP